MIQLIKGDCLVEMQNIPDKSDCLQMGYNNPF